MCDEVILGMWKRNMFAILFSSILLFAVADAAVISDENLGNEVNRFEAVARENTQEAQELPQNNPDLVAIWNLEGADENGSWIKKKVKEVNTKLAHMDNYVRIVVPKFSGEKCVCYHQTCGCCIHAEEPDIHLNSTVCVNVTYLSEDYGISFTVSLNNHTLYNETVSVRNPPPVCVGFPYVKELADICVRLYDIDAKSRTFHACARVEARMKYIIIAHYDLGCFTIGSSSVGDSKKIKIFGNSLPSVVLI